MRLIVISVVSVLTILTLSSIIATIYAFTYYRDAESAKLALEETNSQLRSTQESVLQKNDQLLAQNVQLDEAKNAAMLKSEANQILAEENAALAKEAQAKADINEALAIKNDSLAREAETEAKKAKDSEAQAKKSEAEAKDSEAKAQAEAQKNADLNAIILSRNIAKQATQLDDKESELKALLAKEAFQINADSEEYGDINHPDIYHALYDGLKSLNKEDFNQISNERGAIRSIVFDKSGNTFYTVGSSGILNKWEVTKWNDIEKPKVNQTTLKKFPEVQNVMKISPDNRWLVVGGQGQNIHLFDLNNPDKPKELNLHNGYEVFDIVFVPDNSGFVSSGADKTLQFYNINDNSVKKIANTQTRVEAITITPQKPYLLYYGTVRGKLFEQELNGLPLQLEPNLNKEPLQRITAIEIAQYDQKKILAIGYINGLVKIFQADFGTFPVNRGGTLIYNSSKLHSTRIAALTFNESKQQLGVASYDGTASLWDLTVSDLRQYQPILFDNKESWVMSFAFSKQNNQILIGNRDGLISFFNPDPSVYADEICNKLDRNLNREEWRQYFGSDFKFRKTCP